MIEAGASQDQGQRIVALCGGVGGAKLALGLADVVGENLSVVVNTGDDFEHLGLMISPDLDTVLYTLSGLSDRERGWGRSGESWNFMESLRQLGGETWFQLGDKDLALHIWRTEQLRAGKTLTSVAAGAARKFGIRAQIFPMSDDPVRTIVETADGALEFQRYFVEQRSAPKVQGIRFVGADSATISDGVRDAFLGAGLKAIVFCPSNPFLSIDPMLAIPGLRSLVQMAHVPVVAVSPIIGGKAVKGPAAKIMSELHRPVNSNYIAHHYAGLIDGLIIDEADAGEADTLEIPVKVSQTLMKTAADCRRVARDVLAFVDELSNDAVCVS